MHLFYFLLLVIAVSSATCYDDVYSDYTIYDLEEAEYHFSEFIENFGKNYGRAERQYRFSIFKENLEKINALNRRENFNLHAITQFADMREEEFLEYANCLNTEGLNMTDVNVINLDSLPDVDYPEELDYRSQQMVTEVKDQGLCNDCYIFSAVGNIEGLYAKKHSQLKSLSEQEGLDCAASVGCDHGGLPHEIMQRMSSFGGLVTESAYPYVGHQKQCNLDKTQIVARVVGGNLLQGGEEDLIKALNMYGPLSIGIAVSPTLQHFAGGRVFNDPTCSGLKLSHAVLLVGYGTGSEGPYWLIKNSWATTWGEQGYARLARGVGMCGIGGYMATATVA